MIDMFKNLMDFENNLEEDLLSEIPNNFGMELNFSGIKENDVFLMGVHYHDSDNQDFNIEAEGKNTEELINNLIVNFSKNALLEDYNEKEHYESLYEDYIEIAKNYSSLNKDFDKMKKDYQRLEAEHSQLLANYQKVCDVYNKVKKMFNA